MITNRVIISDGEMLYLFEEKNGHLALAKADPEKLDITSEFQITSKGKGQYWAHPVIHDSRLYIGHDDVLMVYDIQDN